MEFKVDIKLPKLGYNSLPLCLETSSKELCHRSCLRAYFYQFSPGKFTCHNSFELINSVCTQVCDQTYVNDTPTDQLSDVVIKSGP